MTAVVVCVAFTRIAYDHHYKDIDSAKIPYLASFIPSTANSIYILIFSAIYQPVANWLVEFENHEMHTCYENSLIIKIILF